MHRVPEQSWPFSERRQRRWWEKIEWSTVLIAGILLAGWCIVVALVLRWLD